MLISYLLYTIIQVLNFNTKKSCDKKIEVCFNVTFSLWPRLSELSRGAYHQENSIYGNDAVDVIQ